MLDRITGLFGRRRPLTDEELAELRPRISRQRYPEGSEIVKQGEPADRFFVIAEGEVEVIRERPENRDLHIARLGPNDYFGEIGILTRRPRIATVRAISPVTALVFEEDAFRKLMERAGSDRDKFDVVMRARLERLLDAGLGG